MSRKVKIYLIVFVLALTLSLLLSSCDIMGGVSASIAQCCPLAGIVPIIFPLMVFMRKNKKLD